jgi:hypothetical protein
LLREINALKSTSTNRDAVWGVESAIAHAGPIPADSIPREATFSFVKSRRVRLESFMIFRAGLLANDSYQLERPQESG